MTKFAEKTTGWVQRGQSRRGFLATCGKVTLGLGLAMMGLHKVTRTAFAVCCPSPDCNTAHTYPCQPAGAGCPNGCLRTNVTTCCDAGTLHRCYECDCGGATCYCEQVLAADC